MGNKNRKVKEIQKELEQKPMGSVIESPNIVETTPIKSNGNTKLEVIDALRLQLNIAQKNVLLLRKENMALRAEVEKLNLEKLEKDLSDMEKKTQDIVSDIKAKGITLEGKVINFDTLEVKDRTN